MKKRTLVISVLLVAALALGIGYAALSDTLAINGTIKSDGATMNDNFDGLVYFTNGTVTNEPAAHITATVSAAYGGDEASYSIEGLTVVGDKVEMAFVIRNDYSENVWVTIATHDHNDVENLEITNNYEGPIEIEKNGGTHTFTITVELLSLTSETIDLTHNITFDVSDVAPAASEG